MADEEPFLYIGGTDLLYDNMPIATALPFNSNVEGSQESFRNSDNVSYSNSQVHEAGSLNTVQLNTSDNTFSSGSSLHNSTELYKGNSFGDLFPYLSIIEQPKSKWRYRYQSEKGSHGPLPGYTSSSSKKTFPTVKVVNCSQNIEVYVKASLWTTEEFPILHVHKLFGPSCSDDGICTTKINEDGTAVFQDVTILFVAKKDVSEILFQRKLKEKNFVSDVEKKHLKELADKKAKEMNLNSVRICFEAIYFNPNKREYVSLCPPVFSDPVANLKSPEAGDLKICRMSRVTGSAVGGDDVFLLCAKVNKKDIQVRFYEPNSAWEAFGKFTEADVHYQYAIVFQTPPYHRRDIRNPVTVLLQLLRKNGDASEPKEFTYIPDDPDDERINKKRKKNGVYQKFDGSGIYRDFRGQDYNPVVQSQNSLMNAESMNDSSMGSSCNFVGYNDEQLDASVSSLSHLKSFDQVFGSHFLIGSNSENLTLKNNGIFLESHNDPLLSEVNVHMPKWSMLSTSSSSKTDARVHSFIKIDSASVSNTSQPETVKNGTQKGGLAVRSEEIGKAFNKLFVSGEPTTVSENSGSHNVEEATVKDVSNTNTSLLRMEQSQPSSISNSSANKNWYSLYIAAKKGNPFYLLKNSPQLIRLSDERRNT